MLNISARFDDDGRNRDQMLILNREKKIWLLSSNAIQKHKRAVSLMQVGNVDLPYIFFRERTWNSFMA